MNTSLRNPLPNCENAIIEDSKLIEYALNPDSASGKHKARVFQSALGFNLTNWQLLKQAILDTLPQYKAQFKSETIFGKKYTVELLVTGPNGNSAPILTAWQFDRQLDGTLS